MEILIVIACLFLMAVVSCGALAVAYLVVRRLPKADYAQARLIAAEQGMALERGLELGRLQASQAHPAAVPALRMAPAAEPDTKGPFDENPEARVIG